MATIASMVVDGRPFFPCGPCVTSEDCCLYAWPDPEGVDGGPFYPDSDLPDSLIVDGSSIPWIKIGYEYAGAASERISPINNSGVRKWAFVSPSGDLVSVIGDCLINKDSDPSVEDDFPEELHLNGHFVADLTLTRISTCAWFGILQYEIEGEEFIIPCQIEYITNESDLTGEIFPGWPGKACWVFMYSYGASSQENYIKDSPQNSPVGVYDSGGANMNVTE